MKLVLIYSDHLHHLPVTGGVARSDCTGLEIWGSRVHVPLWPAGVALVIPEFNSLVTIENSLLVCLPTVGILNHVMFICIILISSFVSIGPEKKPIWKSAQLRLFLITRYLAAVRLDREPILLGLLPTPYLRSTPSWVPLLCAHLSPCHGSGHKSPVWCGAPDERRNGDHSTDHLDVWHVFLGYYFFVDVSLLVFLW